MRHDHTQALRCRAGRDVLDIFVSIIDELNLNTRIWTKA